MKKKALFILDENSLGKIYDQIEIDRVNSLVDVYSSNLCNEQIAKNPKILESCNIILSGWGGPSINKWFLDNAPNLEAVFYGAGSIRSIVTSEFWKRQIIITSSWAANAVPVAEYTLAQIILCLKNTYKLNKIYTKYYPMRANEITDSQIAFKEMYENRKVFGAYKSVVGIISLGMIGRIVCKLLKNLDVTVLAYDPYIQKEEADSIGIELVDMDYLFANSHVVSLHAPWLPETEKMIKGRHFERMMKGAFFINTARGALVDEEEMIETLIKRSDLTAILDVTYPEPPSNDSQLFKLENVFLTPHIAGSMDDECRRMGRYAVDEMARYLKGEELQYRISEEQFKTMA